MSSESPSTFAKRKQDRPFRVLSLDGGGMRGTYTATYLDRVAATFARRRGVEALDVGAAFDLIAGTSTGGIIACALAAGIPLAEVVQLYRERGTAIFPRPLPSASGLAGDVLGRPRSLNAGAKALEAALTAVLGDLTMGQVYARRGIGLAIPAVEMSQHRSWVFKTPHLARTTNHRDDNYSLVDVCLATTAAPLYRSMAALNHADTATNGYNVFVDGGLWANNPVLVGLIDALEMTAVGDQIEIYCLGTCPVPAGEQLDRNEVHRGLPGWKFGGEAASLSIDAQAFAFDNMARMFARHVDRECSIVRFPADKVPGALLPFLELDDTRTKAMDALINQARTDADMTNSRCGRADDNDARLICGLFDAAPATATATAT